MRPTTVPLLLLTWLLQGKSTAVTNREFPHYFKFGTATAAYQVEGAWNLDGKGENIWDHLCHTNPTFVANSDNGDIACDSYHKYQEDVANLKRLGVHFYRFSLSWSRIIPLGLAGSPINRVGIDYYRNLLQELIDNDIEPMVTLYHWDLPEVLQESGGFTNPEFEEHFAYYARVAFEQLGDLVPHWMTFNEPGEICHQGYGTGTLAPASTSNGLAEYKCAHILLKSHARAYHIYDHEFKTNQRGSVGIVANTPWYEPASARSKDKEASERALQFSFGWFMNPIVNGNYPSIMIDRINLRSRQQGFPTSRLPIFTNEEVKYIKGTYDFVALNTYTTLYAQYNSHEPDLCVVSYNSDINVETYQDASWEDSASSWLKVVPWGVRKLLNWIKKTYNNPEIYITENGVSDNGGLNDTRRINFYKEYLSNVLNAVLEDGVNVTRFTARSFMDNFEWTRGYTEKFGLYSVDFNDPDRPRTPKASAGYYAQVIRTRCLVDLCI